MNIFESVKKGIAFIESNLQREIGVCSVSDHVCYSQFYFSREFSKYTHMSVYDYIIKRKLSESYKQLFNGKVKIADLAFGYGFQSHEVYTRAFKKMFNERPSEAAVYKPLAVLEAIGIRYLHFLNALRVDEINAPLKNHFFEMDHCSGQGSEQARLVLLSKNNFLNTEAVLKGRVMAKESTNLSCGLYNLQKIIRIHHTDFEYSLRYFTEHYYNASQMGGNYIVLDQKDGCIEVMVPAVAEKYHG